MPSVTSRTAILLSLALVTVWLVPRYLGFLFFSSDSLPRMIAESLGSYGETDAHPHPRLGHSTFKSSSSSSSSYYSLSSSGRISPADIYFDQAFSLSKPRPYAFPALRAQCDRTEWKKDGSNGTGAAAGTGAVAVEPAAIYVQCEGIYLGLTSVISQVKSCLKMAIDAGAGVVLPQIPLRDAGNLLVYNQGNPAAERDFGEWFDAAHLARALARACPGLDVVTQADLQAAAVPAANRWALDLHAARFFRERDGYFWAGKPFRAFFDETLARMVEEHKADQAGTDGDGTGDAAVQGELHRRRRGGGLNSSAIVISMRADLELFNVANDPTGHDKHMWDDLGKALRFLPEPRTIVDRLLRQIGHEHFFGVHFRGEGDNMWASPGEQIVVDLDALDRAWEMYRDLPELAMHGGQRPPVYLACGDEASTQAFVEAGRARGWNVTSKYELAKAMATDETMDMIEALPFDFQAIIDLGMMVKSYFFLGIIGSAFSYTAANLRDETSRYRGSSLEVEDDGGARTHLFPNNDIYGDTTMEKYACCL